MHRNAPNERAIARIALVEASISRLHAFVGCCVDWVRASLQHGCEAEGKEAALEAVREQRKVAKDAKTAKGLAKERNLLALGA